VIALRLLAADVVLCLAGLALVGPPARRVGLPLLPRVALALLTGVGMLAVLTTVLAITGGPTAVLPVLGPVLGVLAVAGLASQRHVRPRLGRPGVEVVAYALCLAFTARFAWSAWHNPVRNNDEYGTWALRGTVLSFGRLDPLIMGGSANPRTYQNREYPLGLPAIYSWTRGWVGPAWAEYAGHVQVPLLAGCGMLVGLWVLRQTSGPLVGVLLAPAFFALDWVGGYTGVLLFGDLPAAAAGLSVVLLVLCWLRGRESDWLLLALGPAVAAVNLKQEGLLFVAAPCLIAAAYARAWRPLAVLGVALASLVPWQLWAHGQGIGNRIVRWPTPDPGADPVARSARQAAQLMIGYWPEPFRTRWVVLTALLGCVLAVLLPRVRREVSFLAGTLALVVAGIWGQYVLTAPHLHAGDLASYVAYTAPRVLALPATLVWLLALLPAGAALTRSPTPAERGVPAARAEPARASVPGFVGDEAQPVVDPHRDPHVAEGL
jgi:hypothetical protein